MLNMVSNSVVLQAHAPTYVVILAGGSGQRLWPLSKQATPKQLLSVDGDHSLLEQAIERARRLVSCVSHIWIVTTCAYEEKIREHCVGSVGAIIVEPVARNTAPAIAYCCLTLAAIDPDAHIVFMPSDSYIPYEDTNEFVADVMRARSCVEQSNTICLFGVRPTFAATGYGYIEYQQHADAYNSYQVSAFHEKPDVVTAERYCKQTTMLWNTGMFVGSVACFLREFNTHAADVLSAARCFFDGVGDYEGIPSISVDYAVIEKSNCIRVMPCTYSWTDVGNVTTFLALKTKKRVNDSQHVLVNSHNNLIDVSDKLVALIDIQDVCIVQTDDVLLITKKDSAEKVRTLVTSLKLKNLNQFL